jgi:hypothetical protein
MVNIMEFDCGGRPLALGVENLIIAGWTGRDAAATEHHIAELEAIGVRRPRTIPCFYRVGANLLTGAPIIDVAGHDSSGEAEFVLIAAADGLHVGVGSDHTDRKAETYGVTLAKQMCPKPIGRELWRFADVEAHWDQLVLRSWLTCDGRRELYQEGSVAGMLAPRDLLRRYAGDGGAPAAGSVMFCGTLAARGGIRGGARFEIELEDPVLARCLRHAYGVRELALAD